MNISERRHPDPQDEKNFTEDVGDNRYAPTYRVDFRDGRKPVYGVVSVIEAKLGFFLFLERGENDQVGMIGTNGTRFTFDECKAVLEEDMHSPGYYGGEDQILGWKQAAGVYF